MAKKVAQAARTAQLLRTGHSPNKVGVSLSERLLIITLHGALTRAEQVLSGTTAGAAKVQEFHRQLFAASSGELSREIKRITGVEVTEATSLDLAAGGAAIQSCAEGTMVQIFVLKELVAEADWNAH